MSETQTGYFLPDALGSVRQITDEEGEITLTQSYTPYGEVMASEGTAQTAYAFTGESYDSQTGLVFLRARYYSPSDGRFLSRDTWTGDANMPMSYNSWLYGFSNPLRFVDPSGMISCEKSDDPECVARANELKEFAGTIKNNVIGGKLPVEGLAELVTKAMDLFDRDIRGMMWGTTQVLLGMEPNRPDFWKQGIQKYNDSGSPYFIGQNWLPYLNVSDHNSLNWGDSGDIWVYSLRGDWRKDYWDKTANQAYHFWFSVAVQFFDRGGWAVLANVYHDFPLSWENYDYITSKPYEAPP